MPHKRASDKPSPGNGDPAKKRARGKPFARGPDDRRNMKGRGPAKPQLSLAEEILGVLMEKVPVVKRRKRKHVPKVRAHLEQLFNQSMNGDRTALRGAMMLVRTASTLKSPPVADDRSEPKPAHDEAALQRLLARYDDQIREADRAGRPPRRRVGNAGSE